MTRHETLIAALDNFFAAVDEQRRMDTEDLSSDFREALDAAIDAWADGTTPSYLRPVALRLRDVNADWQVSYRGMTKVSAPEFGSRFWKDINKLRQEFLAAQEKRPAHVAEDDEEEPAEVRYVEPIAALIEQGVSRQQICKMYRAWWPAGAADGPGLWDNLNNRAMIPRLIKEIAGPGSVLGPEHDEFVDFECGLKAQRQQRQRLLGEKIQAMQESRRWRTSDDQGDQQGPDATPLAEMVAAGVCGVQIARMKKTTVEAIEEQCREQDLPIPPRRYSAARETSTAADVGDDVAQARKRIADARTAAFSRGDRQ